jgi:histidinol-phosphate aminotransferase
VREAGLAGRARSSGQLLCRRLPLAELAAPLAGLRAQGIKLRDCASFGLSGHVRLGAAAVSQAALEQAWKSIQ